MNRYGKNIVNKVQEGKAMKQKKLVSKLYKACLDHDAKKQHQLLLKEYAKIFKHRAAGKPFDAKWTVVRG
jgi:hypothetical protein